MVKVRIGITIGDINGIGPEIIIKCLGAKNMLKYVTPVIYGPAKVLSHYRNIVKNVDFPYVTLQSIDEVATNKINVINTSTDGVNITPGEATKDGGRCAIQALERAVEDAKNGKIDAIVTAPINKIAMQKAGFKHIGHTEYLAEAFEVETTVMMMVSSAFKVALVTNHEPLDMVSSLVTRERLDAKLDVIMEALHDDFGIEKPTISVLGVNPHAGDGGLIGTIDKDILVPWITEHKSNGDFLAGPYPADSFFGRGTFKNSDLTLAMYHDQGLAPFKLMSFGSGVNYTAGLPVIRTSPDHGTAYDLVGRNIADPSSLRHAIYLAKDSYLQRNMEVVEGV